MRRQAGFALMGLVLLLVTLVASLLASGVYRRGPDGIRDVVSRAIDRSAPYLVKDISIFKDANYVETHCAAQYVRTLLLVQIPRLHIQVGGSASSEIQFSDVLCGLLIVNRNATLKHSLACFSEPNFGLSEESRGWRLSCILKNYANASGQAVRPSALSANSIDGNPRPNNINGRSELPLGDPDSVLRILLPLPRQFQTLLCVMVGFALSLLGVVIGAQHLLPYQNSKKQVQGGDNQRTKRETVTKRERGGNLRWLYWTSGAVMLFGADCIGLWGIYNARRGHDAGWLLILAFYPVFICGGWLLSRHQEQRDARRA